MMFLVIPKKDKSMTNLERKVSKVVLVGVILVMVAVEVILEILHTPTMVILVQHFHSFLELQTLLKCS